LMSNLVSNLLHPGQDSFRALQIDDINSLQQQYVDGIRDLGLDGKLITDKMPLNFKWIGFILAAFPTAKIIHLSRNPIAVCWSNYKTYFKSSGNGFIYDLEDLVVFYDLYLDLMEYWQSLFPGHIYTLNYETLTEDQEHETRELLAYCDLNFEQACLDFYQNKAAVKTASAIQERKKFTRAVLTRGRILKSLFRC
jgi:hypothetical protein